LHEKFPARNVFVQARYMDNCMIGQIGLNAFLVANLSPVYLVISFTDGKIVGSELGQYLHLP
jgi:hypothetical protein